MDHDVRKMKQFRLPLKTRDEISAIAGIRKTTETQVVVEAIETLGDIWLDRSKPHASEKPIDGLLEGAAARIGVTLVRPDREPLLKPGAKSL